jgi:hypothetical protein
MIRASFNLRVVNSYSSLYATTQAWRGLENFPARHDQQSRHYQVKESRASNERQYYLIHSVFKHIKSFSSV